MVFSFSQRATCPPSAAVRQLSMADITQNLGEVEGVQSRLKTTFDLIERQSVLSSKPIENELNEIRKNFTRSLGRSTGGFCSNQQNRGSKKG